MRRQSGQTLVMAIIILGILMILGFAFAGIISRNIADTSRGRQRNLATELAKGGAEYAHYQLRYSQLGADWRPAPTPPQADAQGFSRDPDSLYLRAADPTRPFSDDPRLANVPDLGGPDGYGPYARAFFDRGRSLVRVRYAPFDYDAFANPNGQLRDPGKARSYLVIEVVGRPGQLRSGSRTDPSLQLPENVKVTNYASLADKTASIAHMKTVDNTLTNTRKMMAFASLGMLESARYIHNMDRLGRPAELGWPDAGTPQNGRPTPFDQASVGVLYGDGSAPYGNNDPTDVRPVNVRQLWGRVFTEPNAGRGNAWTTAPGLGSLYCNADLKLFGEHDLAVNTSFGESWNVAGKILPANTMSLLSVSRTYYDRAVDQWRSNFGPNTSTVQTPIQLAGPSLESEQPAFSTVGSVLRDASGNSDLDGFTRGIPRKDPGSILTVDPQNKQNRFLNMTRDSGRIVNGGNIGRFGLGSGVYVDSNERGNSSSEDERIISGAVKSLPTDWLNPNNASSQGWKGPYYIPLASYLKLLPDGFEVRRDTRSRSPYWRNPDGRSSGDSVARFRVRTVEYPLGSGKFQPMVLDSVQNPQLVTQPGGSLSDDEFRNNGQLFNGVLFFEGDLRVRGVIPTDQQLTVVSMGSIYVEGSVTKGVVTETGAVLTRPSRSAVALMAKDFAVLNPTMFFAPVPGQNVDEKNESLVADTPNPFELKLEDPTITLEAQFLLDPNTPASVGGNPNNPTTWRPFATNYASVGSNTPLSANLLVTSSADDNGPTFVSLDVAPNSYALAGGWGAYLFPRTVTFGAVTEVFNAAAGYFTGVGNIPVYGLGNPTLNSYPKFETVEFPVVTSAFNLVNRQIVPPNANLGDYRLGADDSSVFRVRMNGVGGAPMKNYLANRTAVAPHDVRIEAALYAEQGSFFVIPGNWFNTNTQDTRSNWMDRSAGGLYPNMTNDEANQRRFSLFGNTPSVPFFGEPLDVKISFVGSVSENMPAPINAQAEWMMKWGWIPRQIGSTGLRVPLSHTSGFDPNIVPALPNLTVVHDPVFATGGVWDPSGNSFVSVRRDEYGWVLPPMPRLPVSPTLAYFGEVNP
ncbi:MAG: hypothetical protein JST30_00845 [Armatimonadetes bacterium]|nr:hypothetical protein [Armatimonadota bacterium]